MHYHTKLVGPIGRRRQFNPQSQVQFASQAGRHIGQPQTGSAATQLLRLLARAAWPSSWGAAALRLQGPSHASARATVRKMDNTLYPPRDKAARRLWDTMNKFKKGGGRKSGRELLLPAESGYLRACAHHFAERLGLTHLSMGEGQARRVLLQLPERARGAGDGASSSAADVATDPDEPAAKRKRPTRQLSAAAAAEPGAPSTDEGQEGQEGQEGPEGLAAATAPGVPKRAVPPRKPFMTRLTACMKQDGPEAGR